MNDEIRKINNTLFVPSVTGSTIEDFTQNALILPAAELPPTNQGVKEEAETPTEIPLDYRPPEDVLNENFIPNTSTPTIQSNSPPAPWQNLISNNQANYQPSLQSVFSSVSSYLRGSSEVKPNQTVPSVLDYLPAQTQDNANVQSVPLYPSDLNTQQTWGKAEPPSAPPQGAVNTYRRTTLKRPTYAPIPGLISGAPSTSNLLPSGLPPNPPTQPAPYIPQPFTPLPGPIPSSGNLPPTVPSVYIPPSQSNQPFTTVEGQIPDITGFSANTPFQQTNNTLPNTYFQSESPRPTSTSSASVPHQLPAFTPPQQPAPTLLQPQSIPASDIVFSSFQGESKEQVAAASYFQNTNATSYFSQPIPSNLAPQPFTSNPNILTPSHIYPTMSTNRTPGNSPGNTAETEINETLQIYRPVYQHWFYKREIESKEVWTPFSMADSMNLEQTYLSIDLSVAVVPTDSGRYDVNILRRERQSVYWNSKPSEVRRCSWFRKRVTDGRYIPYEENIATKLEEEFKVAFESNVWNRKVELPNGETVVFHGPDMLVLFTNAEQPHDAWGNEPQQARPRFVKRGMDEFHIDEGEPSQVDHLLFLVHGIGSVCDLKFRSVEEVVDEFRNISLQLIQSHYRSSCDKGKIGRVEVLPISWHEKLHSEDTGVDKKLKGITLESIPKLRDFTNDTILDVLFYTSPIYCQTIISSVGNELNRIYDLFRQRNPDFNGGVSLGGHSLGSLILFDILCHQHPDEEPPEQEPDESEDTITPLKPAPEQRKISRRISYMMGAIGTGQPQLNYPHLNFQPKHFFALGSPIGMFVTVRGLDTLGEQFALPTCPAFFNIFHPYDPVAYRIESLVNPELAHLKPVLIPHHKGRKRMHLELKETMARVGADLKQKLIDSMKSTWNSFYQFALFKSQTIENPPNLEEEMDKVLEEQLKKEQRVREQSFESVDEAEQTDLSLGILNQGKRIDYVLQEAPFEFINEYLFALTSHVCYWESEDTMLLILKEIYNNMNLSPDSQIPQQTMTIERLPPSPISSHRQQCSQASQYPSIDPTLPMTSRPDLGPPPKAGFVRKA